MIYRAKVSDIPNPKRAKCDCGWKMKSPNDNFDEYEYDQVRDHMWNCMSRIKFKYY